MNTYTDSILERVKEHKHSSTYADSVPLALDILKKDAPLTTRTNVKIYDGSSYIYETPNYWVYPGYAKKINNKPNKVIDSIKICNRRKVDLGCLAHELTHAYVWGFAKEARGHIKLISKIPDEKDEHLKEKLSALASSLKEKLNPDAFKEMGEIYNIDEAISYAVQTEYGDILWCGIYRGAFKEDRFEACKELVSNLGIDGARSFVRQKMREIYINNKRGMSLMEEVEKYKQSISTFFEQINNLG